MEGSEYSQITKLEPDEIAGKVKSIFSDLQKIDPESVLCMMGLIVHRDGTVEVTTSGEQHGIKLHAFIVGDDNDIAKMFTTLVTVAKSGIVAANTPEDTDNEVKH